MKDTQNHEYNVPEPGDENWNKLATSRKTPRFEGMEVGGSASPRESPRRCETSARATR